MISTCGCCKRPFWRYRRDFPPAGYCSLPCADKQRAADSDAPQFSPATVLQMIYRHRREAHNTTSVLTWYDCPECEALEAQYGQSITGYYARLAKSA